MPRLVIPVTDTDAAIVAAKSYLKHHSECGVTTYTNEPSHIIPLRKAGLNPHLTNTQPIENKIISDLMSSDQDSYGILISQYSFTRSKILPLEGDRERNWDVAARPPHPFLISDIHEAYSYVDPEFDMRKNTSNFYFGKDIIAFNLNRLRIRYPDITPLSVIDPYHELNIKLRDSQRGVIPGEYFSKPETVIHNNMISAMLLRHQHRLHKNSMVAFDKNCLYWDTEVPMRILMQMNLNDYLACCQEYESLISPDRIRDIKTNIHRQRKRFGSMIDAFSIYDPVFLD